MAINTAISEGASSARAVAYEALKGMILTLELEPGRKLSEKELVGLLHVGRGSVREALVQLVQEELIVTIPQKGSYVSLIDMGAVEEAMWAREALEASVTRSAHERMDAAKLAMWKHLVELQELSVAEGNSRRMFELDEEFHRHLFVSCGRLRSWNCLRGLAIHHRRIRLLRLREDPDWSEVIAQHKKIVAMVEANEADEAARLVVEHIDRLEEDKKRLHAKYPEYFAASV